MSLAGHKPVLLRDRPQVTTPTGAGTGAVEPMALGPTTLRTQHHRRSAISSSSVLARPGRARPDPGRVSRASMSFTIERARELAQADPEVEGVVSRPVRGVGSSGTGTMLSAWVGAAAKSERARSDRLQAIGGTLPANAPRVASA